MKGNCAMQAEDFKDLPVGAEVSFVYKPGITPVSLTGRYLGLKDGMISMRVYRTVNYGKKLTYRSFEEMLAKGDKIVTDYEPGQDSTYNDQTLEPWRIQSLSVASN
jgi:hypothetical protein